MLPAEFFAQGKILKFQRQFLTETECMQIITEMKLSPAVEAQVYGADSARAKGHRDTLNVNVSPQLMQWLGQKVLALIPDLNAFFGTRVNALQTLKFYCYETGGYLAKHQDWIDEMQGAIPKRDVSVVLFLNQVEQPVEPYTGGELVFYLPQKNGLVLGFPLKTETGMLIAFRPEILHEVKTVLSGSRYSVVAWFCHSPLS